MNTELTLARLARDNDGLLTRRGAMAEGCASHQLDRRVAAGFLSAVHPGVYRIAGAADTYRSRVRAAWLWGGPRSLLAGGTVLSMAGLAGFEEVPIELYLPTGKTRPGLKIRRLPGKGLRKRSIQGMSATTIERALLDACSLHPARKVGAAMDDALRRRLTTLERLRAEVSGGTNGVSGAKTFKRLLRNRDLQDQDVRSEMETRMLRILRSIKGHSFIPNYEVSGRKRYFLDFACARAHLGIECHSRRWHGPERVGADLARDRDLKRLGWVVLYFTWDDIAFRADAVRTEIEEFLTSSPDRLL